MAKQIHLGPKKSTLFTTVDDEDYEKLVAIGKWNAQKKRRTHYARHSNRNGSTECLHNVLMGQTPEGMCVDHIDGDGLNNQKNNLRFVTFSQNANHRQRKSIGCSSQYRGVFKNIYARNTAKVWTARIKVGEKRWTLGYFPTEHQAAEAYNEAGTRLLGEFFKPNVIVWASREEDLKKVHAPPNKGGRPRKKQRSMAVELVNHPIAEGFMLNLERPPGGQGLVEMMWGFR